MPHAPTSAVGPLCNHRYSFGISRTSSGYDVSQNGQLVAGVFVARESSIKNEAGYAYGCRIGLAVAAGVHWVGAFLMMSNRFSTASGWEYSRSVRQLAAAVIEALIAG